MRLVRRVPGNIYLPFRLATNLSEQVHTNVSEAILMCAMAEVLGNSKQHVAGLNAAILQLKFRIAPVKVGVLRSCVDYQGLPEAGQSPLKHQGHSTCS